MESTESREKMIEKNRKYCLSKPKSYYSYEDAHLKFSNCENFELNKPLGRGKYSEVYEGYDAVNSRKVVVKLLKPVRKAKIYREIRVL